jgi:tryptophanyl-tRNA synthetase
MSEDKKTLLSGIQPSGKLGIGNYLGAIKNWVKLQDEYNCIFLIVDLHALTLKQVPADFRARCYSYVAQYIACGIDPTKNIVAMQSHIPAHTQLMWIFSNLSYMGEMQRMTQFKDKVKNMENINVGLFSYPILMASDILIYQADLVPVGADQKQHLELARNIAQRFNNQYSDTFPIPEPYIPETGSRIMSLQDPDKKMSKSDDNDNNILGLLDPPDMIVKKIKRAVTDSGSTIQYDEDRPGLANLLNIYSALSGDSIKDIESKFEGKMYSEFKKDLAEVVVESLNPIQNKYNELINDKTYLTEVLSEGAEKASRIAFKTIRKVYKKSGLIQ